MKHVGRILVVVGILLFATLPYAATATTVRNDCAPGYQPVWTRGGVTAVVTGDVLVAVNSPKSLSVGNLYSDGVLLGPAPQASGSTATYPLGPGTHVISAADGPVSVCVAAESTPTTTVPDTTTTTVPETTTTVPDVTSTTTPDTTSTTTPDTTSTTVPAVTSTTVPDVTTTTRPDTPTTVGTVPPTTPDSPPPTTKTTQTSEELPVTGVEFWVIAAAGLGLLATGLLIESKVKRIGSR